MSSVFNEKMIILLEDNWLNPKPCSKVLGTCCFCKEEIFEDEDYKEINDGSIHSECMENLMDEIWDDLASFEKYDLLKDRGIL